MYVVIISLCLTSPKCRAGTIIMNMYLSGFVMKARKQFDVQYLNIYGELFTYYDYCMASDI